MKTNIYDVNICKHDYENNMIRLWCKIVLKIGVEQTKGNEGFYFYLYPCGDVAQRSFRKGFHVCIK